MMALADNPAVADPRRVLTEAQQHALDAIGFYRNHFEKPSTVRIGAKSFSRSTVRKLQELELIRRSRDARQPLYSLTTAGKLAIDKLKGELT